MFDYCSIVILNLLMRGRCLNEDIAMKILSRVIAHNGSAEVGIFEADILLEGGF